MKSMEKRLVVFGLLLSLTAGQVMAKDKSLKVHYTFEKSSSGIVKDVSGNGYDGLLQNNATVTKAGKYAVMDLGGGNGYLDMGEKAGELVATLGDFTVATYLYIDPKTNITLDGNFVFAFATQPLCTQYEGEFSAYKVKIQRYEQSTGGWSREVVGIQTGTPAVKGVWQHIVYTQSGKTGTLYIDGKVVATGDASIQPKDISKPTICNWLGRAPFPGDVFLLNTLYHDFRIYNRGLSPTEISKLAKTLK
jgi:hypothetical protein